MSGFIDLHNHILPGVDDGAATLEESIEIARAFVSEGVDRIVATSHLDPERGNGANAHLVYRLVGEVNEALRVAGVDLTVAPGNELYLTPEAPEILARGDAATLGDGRYVLIEFSVMTNSRPLYLDDTAFRLQLAGYGVILAHPERYPFVQRDVTSLDGLRERGVALQLTAPALLGEYGNAIRDTAETLLHGGGYALAASDRHHPGPSRSLSALHERIVELTDLDTADLLLRENPARVLADRQLLEPESSIEARPSIFSRWFRKAARSSF